MTDAQRVTDDQQQRDLAAELALRGLVVYLTRGDIGHAPGEVRLAFRRTITELVQMHRSAQRVLTNDGPTSWSDGYQRGVASTLAAVADVLCDFIRDADTYVDALGAPDGIDRGYCVECGRHPGSTCAPGAHFHYADGSCDLDPESPRPECGRWCGTGILRGEVPGRD